VTANIGNHRLLLAVLSLDGERGRGVARAARRSLGAEPTDLNRRA
jgi:hypothetical protein